MKLSLLFFTLLFAFSPLPAQSPAGLQDKVSAKVIKRPPLQPIENAALEQLAERQDPLKWKYISWQEFLKQNEHAKSREGVCIRCDIKSTENLCNTCPEPIPLDLISKITQEPIDYKELLKDEKLIYIMDGNTHNTKAAPREVVKILQAVREANPNAKILLATEFLIWDSRYNLLGTRNIKNDLLTKQSQYLEYYEYYSCKELEMYKLFLGDKLPELQKMCSFLKNSLQLLEQEIQNPTTLLKKAGQKSQLYESNTYAPIFQAADRLGIDQLALDDNLYGEDTKNNIGVKVGEYVIQASPKDKIPSWKQLQEKYKEYDKNYRRSVALEQIISISSWGVLERNREWARRIKALLPAYDIVLIYAGNGHLDHTYFIDLQPMVGKADFVNIKLYPLEELPQKLAEFYEQRNSLATKKGFSRDEKNWEERANADIEYNRLFQDPAINFEYDPTKPLWSIIGSQWEDFLQANSQKYQALIEEMQKQAELMPYSPGIIIEVYLPAD